MLKRPLSPFLVDIKTFGGRYTRNKNTISIFGTPPIKQSYNFISTSISSQFFSGAIIFGGLLKNSVKLNLSNPNSVSLNYVKLTQKCASLFGGKITKETNFLKIHPTNYQKNGIITIPDDPCSTLYLITLSILLKWKIYFSFTRKKMDIGEWKAIYILKKMGCTVKFYKTNFSVSLDGPLQKITESLKDFPDNAPTILFLCSFVKGVSKIYNIAHLKYKESDRLLAMSEFYSKLNIKTKEIDGCLHIEGNPTFLHTHTQTPHIFLDAKYDHRISMIFLIASTIYPNVWVKNFTGVEKSFPDFWNILKELDIKYVDRIVC